MNSHVRQNIAVVRLRSARKHHLLRLFPDQAFLPIKTSISRIRTPCRIRIGCRQILPATDKSQSEFLRQIELDRKARTRNLLALKNLANLEKLQESSRDLRLEKHPRDHPCLPVVPEPPRKEK